MFSNIKIPNAYINVLRYSNFEFKNLTNPCLTPLKKKLI